MNKKITLSLILTSLIGITSVVILASPDGHDEEKKAPMAEMKNSHDEMNETMGSPSDEGSHGHKSWVVVPDVYEEYNGYSEWTDFKSAQRGVQLYQDNCLACHGDKGLGNGEASMGLDHKPADLTQHFHSKDESNDGYLFWRISEGGTAEPFKSQNSMMPAFKDVLSEQQRWDVLTYMHLEFHDGFVKPVDMGMVSGDDSDGGHDDNEEPHG